MSKAFVMWQDEETREWFVVGRLEQDEGNYTFCYTKGAKKASPRFQPFTKMERFENRYVSNELFPLFANRMLPKSRPEYTDFIRWLGLEGQPPKDIVMLARGEGKRETDNVTLHACPEKDNGRYSILFFSHGIRYGFIPENTEARLKDLKAEDRLFPAFDTQNPKDPDAILLRTDDPIQFVGYCPRYLAQDFKELEKKAMNLRITVERVNFDAPPRFRLLCKATADWPDGFEPCSGEQYQPITSS